MDEFVFATSSRQNVFGRPEPYLLPPNNEVRMDVRSFFKKKLTYYERNKERLKEMARVWRENNPNRKEEKKAHDKKYREKKKALDYEGFRARQNAAYVRSKEKVDPEVWRQRERERWRERREKGGAEFTAKMTARARVYRAKQRSLINL